MTSTKYTTLIDKIIELCIEDGEICISYGYTIWIECSGKYVLWYSQINTWHVLNDSKRKLHSIFVSNKFKIISITTYIYSHFKMFILGRFLNVILHNTQCTPTEFQRSKIRVKIQENIIKYYWNRDKITKIVSHKII